MTYKAIVMDAAPKAKKMAAAIEEKANELAKSGWELVSFCVTGSDKAIVVFRVPEEIPEPAGKEAETVEVVGEAE